MIIDEIALARKALKNSFINDGLSIDEVDDLLNDCIKIPKIRKKFDNLSLDDAFDYLVLSELIMWDYDSRVVTYGPKTKKSENVYRDICQNACNSILGANENILCIGPIDYNYMLIKDAKLGISIVDIESKSIMDTGASEFSQYLYETAKMASVYYGESIKNIEDKNLWKEFLIDELNSQFINDKYIYWSLQKRPSRLRKFSTKRSVVRIRS